MNDISYSYVGSLRPSGRIDWRMLSVSNGSRYPKVDERMAMIAHKLRQELCSNSKVLILALEI